MKNLFKFKERLAGGVRRYGRVLSLIVVAMMLSTVAHAGTYYFDLRDIAGLTAENIVINYVQTDENNKKVKCIKNYPENKVIKFNHTFTNEYVGKIKFEIAWNGGLSTIEWVRLSDIESHNCIKILKGGRCNNSSCGEYISFTDYVSPLPSTSPTLPVLDEAGKKTRFEGTGLMIYVAGYGTTDYDMYKNTDAFTLVPDPDNYDYKTITAEKGQAAEYVYYNLAKVPTTGKVNKFTLTHTDTGDCAVITFTGSSFTSAVSCNSTPASHAPSIRIGKQPTTDGNTATINLQMADWGCAAVDQVRVYYTTNDTEPTTSSSYFDVTGLNIESNTNFDVEKSDLASGTYRIKVAAHNSVDYGDLSDEASFTVEKICTQPQAANFHVSGLTGKTYTGTNQSPAINPDEGMGTMTVKYDGVAGTGKTDAGTYAITVSVAEGNIFCASTEDISLGDFVIGKANREISISNTEQSLATCENNTITLTSTTTAPEDGTITYSTVSGGTGAGSIDGDKLSCTTAGTVKVQVSITGGTNYNDATSNQATATFYALPTAGSITASPASPICKGTSTTLTVAGFTEGSTLQWYKGSSIPTGQTSASYITEALSEAATYKVVVTKNNCISETSDFTVEVKSTSLEITATPAIVNPYTPVTLTAKNQSGTETNSNWTITGAGSYFTESENPTGVSTVVMKPAKDVETTVTATATVDGCQVSDTYIVTPTADTETCN